MKRNPGKLQCDATTSSKSSNSQIHKAAPADDQAARRKREEELKLGKQSSGSKKHSKLLDKSPTKKSREHLNKITGDDEDNVPAPGIKKFTKDISDVGAARLPHIPDHEVQQYMIQEDLSEVERIKVLLKKETQDQKSYLFNNIENIFLIDKGEYHNIYGHDYDQEKSKRKEMRYNYETQPQYGTCNEIVTKEVKQEENENIQMLPARRDSGDGDAAGEVCGMVEDDSEIPQGAPNGDGDDEVKLQQEHAQEEIFPIVFGDWLQAQGEYIQILAGEAFLVLLKHHQFTFKAKFLVKLKDDSLTMLSQWSADIIEIWIEVYAISLSQIIKRKDQFTAAQIEACREQCRSAVQRMIDRNQMIKVRIKAASLLGLLAQYNSLGEVELYERLFLGKLRPVCQDLHWEVRKDMCASLIHISRYIGKDKSFQYVLPELKELLDDEEGEVVTEAIVSFQKHLDQVYDEEFVAQDETMEVFAKLCDLTVESTMCLVDLAVVLKKLGKYIVTFNRPHDGQFLRCVLKLINKATKEQDEEVRAMIPCIFKPFCDIYSKNMPILIDFYHRGLTKFLSAQIKLGTKQEEDVKISRLPKSIYSEILGKEIKKYNHQVYSDNNYLVNRSIAQNLHFFFGAFLSLYENLDPKLLDQINLDSVNHCLTAILENYKLLIQTKDRDLLHHVVFSFKNYHEKIAKVDIWLKLPEAITVLYQDIINNDLKKTLQIQKNSWRYLITCMKAMETIIDSNFEYNEAKAIQMLQDKSEKERVTMGNQIRQFELLLQSGRKDALKILEGILVDKSMPNPVRQYVMKILAQQMTSNKQSKIRQSIQDFTIKLSKLKGFQMKKSYMELVEYMVNEQMISSRTFQRFYFDSMLQIFDQSNIPSFQLMIVDAIFPKIFKLIMDKQNLVDKFKQSANLLKMKHIQNLQINPQGRDKLTKQELVRSLDRLQQTLADKTFHDTCREYLLAVDGKILRSEMEISGGAYDDEERSQSLLNLEKNFASKQKKATSVRPGSKQQPWQQGQAAKQDPVDVTDKMDAGRKRIKSLRPPSQGFQRRPGNPSAINKNQDIANQFCNEKMNGRKVNKSKYGSTYGVQLRNELPNLMEESNENLIDSNPFTIMQNKDQLSQQRQSTKSTPVSRGDSGSANSNNEGSRHSDQPVKGKAQMITMEPQIITGRAGRDYAGMLPPKAKGFKPKQYNALPSSNSLLDQYRSKQQNSCYTKDDEQTDKLTVEQRDSQKFRNDEVQTNDTNNNINSISTLNHYIEENPSNNKLRQANNQSAHQTQLIQLNNKISQRKNNFTSIVPNSYQKAFGHNVKNFIKIEYTDPADLLADIGQNAPGPQQAINIDSGTYNLMKNKQSKISNQQRVNNYRNRNYNKFSIDENNRHILNLSEQVNEICANHSNDLQPREQCNGNGNNVNKLYARATNSISPSNTKVNSILSSIPSIPNIPKRPAPAPRTQEMQRKSSQGFIQYKRQHSRQKLQTANQQPGTQLPDVRISRKSNLRQFTQDKSKIQVLDQASPIPSAAQYLEKQELFGKRPIIAKNKKY